MSDLDISIKGLQELQAKNLKRIAALRPSGPLGQAIKDATLGAHRYAVSVTHVLTGSLRASHRAEIKGTRGRIYIDPSAHNPRGKTKPVEYGYYENRRGGSHAFYDRTVEEYGAEVQGLVIKRVQKEME